MTDWAPSPSDQARYAQLWQSLSGSVVDGYAPAHALSTFLATSGLDNTTLVTIWDLADNKDTGRLNFSGFCVACRLVALAQAGVDVSHAGLVSTARMNLQPSFGGVGSASPAPHLSPPHANALSAPHYASPQAYYGGAQAYGSSPPPAFSSTSSHHPYGGPPITPSMLATHAHPGSYVSSPGAPAGAFPFPNTSSGTMPRDFGAPFPNASATLNLQKPSIVTSIAGASAVPSKSGSSSGGTGHDLSKDAKSKQQMGAGGDDIFSAFDPFKATSSTPSVSEANVSSSPSSSSSSSLTTGIVPTAFASGGPQPASSTATDDDDFGDATFVSAPAAPPPSTSVATAAWSSASKGSDSELNFDNFDLAADLKKAEERAKRTLKPLKESAPSLKSVSAAAKESVTVAPVSHANSGAIMQSSKPGLQALLSSMFEPESESAAKVDQAAPQLHAEVSQKQNAAHQGEDGDDDDFANFQSANDAPSASSIIAKSSASAFTPSFQSQERDDFSPFSSPTIQATAAAASPANISGSSSASASASQPNASSSKGLFSPALAEAYRKKAAENSGSPLPLASSVASSASPSQSIPASISSASVAALSNGGGSSGMNLKVSFGGASKTFPPSPPAPAASGSAAVAQKPPAAVASPTPSQLATLAAQARMQQAQQKQAVEGGRGRADANPASASARGKPGASASSVATGRDIGSAAEEGVQHVPRLSMSDFIGASTVSPAIATAVASVQQSKAPFTTPVFKAAFSDASSPFPDSSSASASDSILKAVVSKGSKAAPANRTDISGVAPFSKQDAASVINSLPSISKLSALPAQDEFEIVQALSSISLATATVEGVVGALQEALSSTATSPPPPAKAGRSSASAPATSSPTAGLTLNSKQCAAVLDRCLALDEVLTSVLLRLDAIPKAAQSTATLRKEEVKRATALSETLELCRALAMSSVEEGRTEGGESALGADLLSIGSSSLPSLPKSGKAKAILSPLPPPPSSTSASSSSAAASLSLSGSSGSDEFMPFSANSAVGSLAQTVKKDSGSDDGFSPFSSTSTNATFAPLADSSWAAASFADSAASQAKKVKEVTTAVGEEEDDFAPFEEAPVSASNGAPVAAALQSKKVVAALDDVLNDVFGESTAQDLDIAAAVPAPVKAELGGASAGASLPGSVSEGGFSPLPSSSVSPAIGTTTSPGGNDQDADEFGSFEGDVAQSSSPDVGSSKPTVESVATLPTSTASAQLVVTASDFSPFVSPPFAPSNGAQAAGGWDTVPPNVISHSVEQASNKKVDVAEEDDGFGDFESSPSPVSAPSSTSMAITTTPSLESDVSSAKLSDVLASALFEETFEEAADAPLPPLASFSATVTAAAAATASALTVATIAANITVSGSSIEEKFLSSPPSSGNDDWGEGASVPDSKARLSGSPASSIPSALPADDDDDFADFTSSSAESNSSSNSASAPLAIPLKNDTLQTNIQSVADVFGDFSPFTSATDKSNSVLPHTTLLPAWRKMASFVVLSAKRLLASLRSLALESGADHVTEEALEATGTSASFILLRSSGGEEALLAAVCKNLTNSSAFLRTCEGLAVAFSTIVAFRLTLTSLDATDPAFEADVAQLVALSTSLKAQLGALRVANDSPPLSSLFSALRSMSLPTSSNSPLAASLSSLCVGWAQKQVPPSPKELQSLSPLQSLVLRTSSIAKTPLAKSGPGISGSNSGHLCGICLLPNSSEIGGLLTGDLASLRNDFGLLEPMDSEKELAAHVPCKNLLLHLSLRLLAKNGI